MADQIITLVADAGNTGKKVDVSELTVGANTVERQRVCLADPSVAGGLATIKATNAALDETAIAALRTASVLFAQDTAAAAQSQMVTLQVEATAHPNLRVGLYAGANEATIKAASTLAQTTDTGLVTRPLAATDGTHSTPIGDAVARSLFVTPNDGTNAVTVKAASTAALATDTALVVRPLLPTDGTHTQPAGDAIARALSVTPSDGTNAFLSGSAANVAASTSINALLVSRPGDWVATSAPAVNTQASAARAAGGAGVRHVLTSLSINLAAGGTAPAATQLTVNLRDGATGAGAILATWTIAIPATAGAFSSIQLPGLHIVGSAATAMTLEFAAAGGANTYESVTFTGHDCV